MEYRVPDWFRVEQKNSEIPRSYEVENPVERFENFIEEINQAQREFDCQYALEKFPWAFMQFMRTGHGNWLFSRPRFSGEFIPDFIFAEGSSAGLFWQLVELESPLAIPFKKDGTESNALRTAIQQIRDWRSWLISNGDLARRPKSMDGYGFAQLTEHAYGMIIIGRRLEYPDKYNEVRRRIETEQRIKILSYDSILELAGWRLCRPPKSREQFIKFGFS